MLPVAQQPPTPPAATTTTNPGSTAANSNSSNSYSGHGPALPLTAPVDVTALLDSYALDQLRIEWSDIKLAAAPLGRGGFGAVYRGSWQGNKVAVKMLEGVSTAAAGDLRREALIMSRVRHPGIAVVYGLAVADSDQQATNNGHAAVALVMK
jgi:hypothetical protein